MFVMMLGVTALSMSTVRSSANLAAPPTILDVNPNELPNATNMYITITGDNFVPTPTLALGIAPLRDVTFIDSHTLAALVPWGLSPGSYTLTVVNPDGQSGAKENAILVYQESSDWESNGPYGGFVTGVFIDPHNISKIYACAWSSGLFVSSDSAGNWQPVYINPMPTELVFQYYDGERHLYIGGNDGLMHSANDGLTWEQFIPDEVELWRDPFDFHAALNSAEPDAVYLGVSGNPGTVNGGGLFKYSYLIGDWTKIYPNDLHVMSVAFSPSDPDRIYFGTREGQFYASPDGGITWADPVTVSTHIQNIAVDPFLNSGSAHNIWVATNGFGYLGNGAFLSQDDGFTFQRINNLPNPDAWVNSITIHPIIPGMIWLATNDGGYVTIDNGLHWSSVSGGLPQVWRFALQPDPGAPADPAQMTVYAATSAGVYKSVDGGQTWQASNQGLAAVIPESLAVNPQNPDEAYASTPSLNILKTIDGGRNWQSLDIPFAGWRARMAVDPFTPRIVYFPGGCHNPCVRVSPDGGTNYQTVVLQRPAEIPDDWGGYVTVIIPDPEQPGRLLAGAMFGQYLVQDTYGVIYIRENAVADWQVVKVLAGQVKYIYFDPHNSQRVYAATDAGLYRSQDRGETWNRLDTPESLKHISLVTVHPEYANVIYIYNWAAPGEDLSVQAIYISQDDGATWALLTDEEGNRVYTGPVWEMGFAPIGPRIFYIATFDGLYRSMDNGHTITPVEGLPGEANVQALGFGYDLGLNGNERLVIYVGTTGGYRIAPSSNDKVSKVVQTGLMRAGIYRSSTVFHNIYLPFVSR